MSPGRRLAREANLLARNNDDLLAIAARYEKVAPIVYHTLYQKNGSILLRKTDSQAGQRRVWHIWKKRHIKQSTTPYPNGHTPV